MDLSKESQGWEMFFGGLRLSLGYEGKDVFAAVDLELGGGVGRGGEYEGNDGATDWESRSASGVYVGAGLGLTAHWFSVFVRGRHQTSWATEVPETAWWSFLVGVEATIADSVNLYVGAGGYKYTNSMDRNSDPLLEFGLSIELPIYYKPSPEKKKPPLEIPVARKEENQPWPPPVPVKKEPPKEAGAEKEPDKVVEESPARLRVQPEVELKPCPSGALVVGQPPPDGFEMFCAVEDAKVRWKHHGWYVGWYDNGQRASEGEYVDGKRHGAWIFWHHNGQKRLEAGYRMGEKRGRWTFWDRDGAETKVIDYPD